MNHKKHPDYPHKRHEMRKLDIKGTEAGWSNDWPSDHR